MAQPAGQKWWSKDTVAVITGGNRGIGLEIATQLGTNGLIVVLADMVSDEELRKTAEGLEEKLEEKLGSTLPSPRVYSHQLDIRSDGSVQKFAAWLKEKFGHISILINNAGIGPRAEDFRHAESVMETNFWGNKRITEALLPLLTSPEGSRIVFMASRAGLHTRLGDGYGKRKLSDVEHLTEDDLDDIGRRFLDAIKGNRVEQEGWLMPGILNPPGYGESKMLILAYTVLLAKSLQSEGKPISVNALCPGPTTTDMLKDDAKEVLLKLGWHIRSLPEGADTAVWLALLPKDDGYLTGKLFGERKEIPYDFKEDLDT